MGGIKRRQRGSAGDPDEKVFRHVKVGVDVLDVVVVFERLAEPEDLPGDHLVAQWDGGVWYEGKFLSVGSNTRLPESIGHGVESIVRRGDDMMFVLGVNVFRTGFEREFEQFFFVDARARDGDLPSAFEQIRHTPAGSKVPVIL